MFWKLEIPAAMKYEFCMQLSNIGISAATLFPGLDGIGRSIKKNAYIDGLYCRSSNCYPVADPINPNYTPDLYDWNGK